MPKKKKDTTGADGGRRESAEKQKSRYGNNRTIVNRIFNDVFTVCCVVYKQLFTLSFITIHTKKERNNEFY